MGFFVEYTVKKNLAGRHRVHFQCSHCNSVLESPLEEAGQEFDCPMCGRRIATPGQPDLAKLKAAVENRQKAMEEERRISQERAAAAARRDAVVRKQEEEHRERERLELIDKPSFADRLLSLAFKFAKAVSVIVIISCFLTVAVCLVILPTVQPVKVSQATAPMLAPSLAEYQEYMKPASDTSPAATGGQPTAPNSATPLSRFEAIVQPFGLAYSHTDDFIGMDSDTQEALITGLAGFIRSFQADSAAVNWYLETFKARLDAVAAEKRELASQQELADLAASTRRQELLVAIGGAIAGLLSFLFLPLMIQIEQNTRRSLALQAAERKGASPTA